MAILSRTLGTINTKSPLDIKIEDLKVKEWDKEKVLELFTKLRFNKYIDRFSLRNEEKEINPYDEIEINDNLSESNLQSLINQINENKQIIYYLGTINDENEEKIIKKEICNISIIIENKVYYIDNLETIKKYFKEIFEDEDIKKIGYNLKQDYIILKQNDIELSGIEYDASIAGYILDSIKNKYDIETLTLRYLNLQI